MKFYVMLAIVAFAAAPALAEEKVEINVSNSRAQPITMRFSYAFRDKTWQLMEHNVSPSDDLTYRFPANIPGCEKLHEWGIADGMLSIEEKGELLCEQRISLCDKIVMFMDVRNDKCVWRKSR